jgi:hypothetical protein
MSEDAPDLEALAKRFLDLWQDQVAASVADPALAEWLSRFLAAPGAPGAVAGLAKHGETPNDAAAFADIFAAMAAGYTPGAPPAAASSGAGDDRLDELSRRLADCEKRLSALEPGAGKPGGKPRRRPRKRADR